MKLCLNHGHLNCITNIITMHTYCHSTPRNHRNSSTDTIDLQTCYSNLKDIQTISLTL